MPIRELIEQVVAAENFSMPQLADAVWPLVEEERRVAGEIHVLRGMLQDNYRKLSYSVLRNAFLIELVKFPKVETTKFRVRWFHELDGDPRYCSFDECLDIAVELLRTLPVWIQNPAHAECLTLSFSNGIIPYEAPLDYVRRITEQGRLHQYGNLLVLRRSDFKNTEIEKIPDF